MTNGFECFRVHLSRTAKEDLNIHMFHQIYNRSFNLPTRRNLPNIAMQIKLLNHWDVKNGWNSVSRMREPPINRYALRHYAGINNRVINFHHLANRMHEPNRHKFAPCGCLSHRPRLRFRLINAFTFFEKRSCVCQPCKRMVWTINYDFVELVVFFVPILTSDLFCLLSRHCSRLKIGFIPHIASSWKTLLIVPTRHCLWEENIFSCITLNCFLFPRHILLAWLKIDIVIFITHTPSTLKFKVSYRMI